jgi:hypothetical protein
MKIISMPWSMFAGLQKMTEANFILVRLAPFTVKPKQCQLMKMHRFKLRCLLWKYQANREEIITDVAKVYL